MGYIWLLIFAAMIITEIATATALVSIWFALGALAAFAVSAVGFGFTAQLVAFIVVSVLLLIFTKPFVKKIIKPGYTPTNTDRLLGELCIVVDGIDDMGSKGSVIIDGKEWSAVSDDGKPIESGSRAKVMDIRGVKLVVHSIEGDD